MEKYKPFYPCRAHDFGPGAWAVSGPNFWWIMPGKMMAYAIAAFLNNPSENSEIESMRQLCIVSSNKPEDYVAELMRLVKVKNDSTD